MKSIDINTWQRRQIYEFYKDIDIPRYHMTFMMDVTSFYTYVKANHHSFYLSMMHTVISVMNGIENFRYRFVDEKPCLFDVVHPSYTDVIEGTDLFKIVTVDYVSDLSLFELQAKAVSKAQKDLFIDLDKESREDLVYVTSFPWACYTQVSHASSLNRYDAIPRVAWGKFERKEGRLMMPFSMEVHHAFVDGFHVGQLINRLQKRLDTINDN